MEMLPQLLAGKTPDALILDLVSAGTSLEVAKQQVSASSAVITRLRDVARASLANGTPAAEVVLSLIRTHGVGVGVGQAVVDEEIRRRAEPDRKAADEMERQKGQRARARLWGIPLVAAGVLLAAPTGGGSLAL